MMLLFVIKKIFFQFPAMVPAQDPFVHTAKLYFSPTAIDFEAIEFRGSPDHFPF